MLRRPPLPAILPPAGILAACSAPPVRRLGVAGCRGCLGRIHQSLYPRGLCDLSVQRLVASNYCAFRQSCFLHQFSLSSHRQKSATATMSDEARYFRAQSKNRSRIDATLCNLGWCGRAHGCGRGFDRTSARRSCGRLVSDNGESSRVAELRNNR